MTTSSGGPVTLASQSQVPQRPYTPSPWGDFFLHHIPCTPSQYSVMTDKAKLKKEEVKTMLLDMDSFDLHDKLEFIDTLERLGLGHHYIKEIHELLSNVYKVRDRDLDLPTTSLWFYLLRKHGYHISSDIFLKFIDDKGNIVSNDASSLLRLYDAGHLRVHGEEILDNILTSSKSQLECIIENLEPVLKEEVEYALNTPLFRRLNRIEAREYISVYEKKTTHNDAMLEFAKLDFNILLTLYCKELKELTLWWIEFQIQANTSNYARDRIVEMHFWMLGVFYEPQYSYSRKMLTQLFMIVSILDDLYDSHCTTEEGKIFAAALQRWDEEAAQHCPAYLRNLYINIFATVNAIEEELKLQNNKHAKLIIDMAKCYHAEVEWRDKKYVPATVEEHLKISARSSGCMHFATLGFISMGDVASTEAIEWASTYPKIIRAVCIIARLANDIMSYKREEASKNMVSTLQACAREFGITIEQAIEKLRELVEEAWMDITEECLRQQHPMVLLERAVNLARTMDFLYKDTDGYTDSHSIKDTLDSLYLMSMKETAQVQQEKVRDVILEIFSSSSLVQKMELIDTLQRIGVDYQYNKEINELLCSIYNDKDGGSDSLYITSLRFYLLRKHGYTVSSDVFEKFRDDQGNISSNDVNCLLMLYDAAHMRTHGEEILDNIISFNKSRLQSVMMGTDLEPALTEEVRFTLETTRFRRVERVEARRFISVYEKNATRNEAILEFAKLDYNILQVLYCEELKELTIWWKDFQSRTDLRFARDRLVEIHFWMMAVVYEPYYSYSRIMLTKLIIFVSLFDDLYDNYSTTEESNIFTSAMERWDVKAAEQFPAYLRAFYENILGTTDEIVEELKRQNNKHAELVRKLIIDMAKRYHAEVKWRDEHYVPSTVDEHLQISVRSSACMHITNIAFISLGDVTTREAVEWAFTYPKIIRGVCIVGRIGNDIVSHEREQALDHHMASTVQTCMKQYGVTVEEANEKLRVIIEKAWMDIVQECLDQKHPMVLLEKAVHLGRTMDFMYKREDAYTLSFSLKDIIASMYINSCNQLQNNYARFEIIKISLEA
ncbi:hypothetical protein U9M48_040934 [Paspalum notatum var. saurae]|uniref:Uncharacterized protein n=1 Tax=Paspalum notatum var. saurae TaxID=547442 RepID=A0AAQ3UM56_PASNO